jgi:hypothetical protein
MVLQTPIELVKVVPGSDSDTCHAGNQGVSVKEEDVTDIQEDEDDLLIASPAIKAEQEVRFCIYCSASFLDMQIACFVTYLSLSFHMKQVPSGELILKNAFQNSKILYIFVSRCLCSTCFKQPVSQYLRPMILHIE